MEEHWCQNKEEIAILEKWGWTLLKAPRKLIATTAANAYEIFLEKIFNIALVEF